MDRLKVGIVGGGPGGLMTAYCLQKIAPVPYSATLFEASSRLGGKILTPQFDSAKARYEAGAAELYDYSPVDDDPLRDLVAELGLSVCPMRGSAVIVNHRTLANLEDVRDALGPNAREALAHFDRVAKDRITPREFYNSNEPDASGPGLAACHGFDSVLNEIPEPAARQFVESMIHSDLATEPKHTSAAYGLHNYLMNDPAYMELYSIEGGNERLPRELAARLHATILLECAVTEIAKADNHKLAVTSKQHGELRRDEFDFVVIALPNYFLPTLAFREARLTDAIRRHHAHYDHPAHYLRITILFDRPFWHGLLNDSYWMLDSFGGCCLYDESSREPGSPHSVLGWLLAGEAARKMSELPDEQLIAEALDSLPDFLAHGRGHFREARVHRWVGAVSAMPGGVVQQPLDQRHQPEPVEHPNLFLVGDYLFDSTLNGVLDSAEYVAGWIGASMSENPREPA
ncbi:MAG: amine oxidase [Planctomycetaceae bacterium]|nr:amine oxidase [Planctomycetaceae bacterium]